MPDCAHVRSGHLGEFNPNGKGWPRLPMTRRPVFGTPRRGVPLAIRSSTRNVFSAPISAATAETYPDAHPTIRYRFSMPRTASCGWDRCGMKAGLSTAKFLADDKTFFTAGAGRAKFYRAGLGS